MRGVHPDRSGSFVNFLIYLKTVIPVSQSLFPETP